MHSLHHINVEQKGLSILHGRCACACGDYDDDTDGHVYGMNPVTWGLVSFPDPTSHKEKGLVNLGRIPRPGRIPPQLCYNVKPDPRSDWSARLSWCIPAVGKSHDWAKAVIWLARGNFTAESAQAVVGESHDCAKAAIWLARGNSTVQAQGFDPSSPDPFPSWGWGSGHETTWG